MKNVNEIKKDKRIKILRLNNDGFAGEVGLHGWRGSVICSTGAGWEHVSVSPYQRRIVPSWDDMCSLKDMFWHDEEAVIQVHPPKSEYVNNMPNCLHLWRCTYREMILPPSCLVGLRSGQTYMDVMKEIKEAYKMAGEQA